MHVVERIRGVGCGLALQPISKDVAHHARRAVIDWHAALLPGLAVPPADDAQESADGQRPRTVALINGSARAHGRGRRYLSSTASIIPRAGPSQPLTRSASSAPISCAR